MTALRASTTLSMRKICVWHKEKSLTLSAVEGRNALDPTRL